MLIHCLRHGATEANLARRFNGSRDDPLTEVQRHALRNVCFDHAQYDAIYCSPLRRAIETAEWIEDASSYSRVLAITHGGTVDFLYRLASGCSLHGGKKIFSSDDASLSIFDVNWPDVRLIDYNIGLGS